MIERAEETPEPRDPERDPEATDPDEARVEEEADAAAAEAARIGGRSGMEDMDEEERPVREHGGGEAEGFEQAEDLLEGQASHRDASVEPLADAAEEEEDPAVHGEPDELESTETDVDTQGTPGDLDHSADEDEDEDK